MKKAFIVVGSVALVAGIGAACYAVGWAVAGLGALASLVLVNAAGHVIVSKTTHANAIERAKQLEAERRETNA